MLSDKLHNYFKAMGKGALLRLFNAGQRLGVDILPRHFYSSIPDMRNLARSTYWRIPHTMRGCRGTDVDEQLAFASDVCRPYVGVLSRSDIHGDACREVGHGGYGPVEGDFLYCLVRSRRPKRILQVGCGVSTAIILRAARDEGCAPETVCVDPFPTPFLRDSGRRGDIVLVAKPAQEVGVAALAELRSHDMLVVDSTHTVKVGSEVVMIILELMPQLAPGVLVHFHDIYFPFGYPRSLFSELFVNMESVLLLAFLTGNAQYTLRASLSMLHYFRREELRGLIPRYHPGEEVQGLAGSPEGHFPSATWLEVIGDPNSNRAEPSDSSALSGNGKPHSL